MTHNLSLFANVGYGEMLTVQPFFRLLIDQAPEVIGIAGLHAAKRARQARKS